MSGTVKSFSEVVSDFNLSAQTEFNQQYEMLEPELQNFAFKYNAGNVSNTKFFMNMLFGDIKEWKGTQEYEKVDKIIKQQVEHVEYAVEGIEIPKRDFKRAQAANSITGLDMYTKMIGDRALRAKDGPYEIMLDFLLAGDSNVKGTCFDGQNLFDTTHDFSSTPGTQSNLLTGTGTGTAALSTDLKAAISAFKSFHYSTNTGDNSVSKRRPLNKGNMKLVVVCDSSLYSAFNDLRVIENIVVDDAGGSQTNSLRNSFEVVSMPLKNQSDWFVIEVSEPSRKPFLISMEDEGELHLPDENSPALVNLQTLRYAFNGLSFGVAYGAWWKAVKCVNV